MTVYESVIQVVLYPDPNDAVERTATNYEQLRSLRDLYFEPTMEEPTGVTTQERALIRMLEVRSIGSAVSCISSHANCVLNLIYGVFGVDTLAYLFDQSWVPATTVNPFRPGLYLKRLSVLERTASELKDGARTPVWLPETAQYFRPGMGPSLECFKDKEHRLLLDHSLRELREFGELGLSLAKEDREPSVEIGVYDPYHSYYDDPAIQAFVAGRTSTESERKGSGAAKTP
jgi:hypothetical protein